MRYWQLNRCFFGCFLKTPRVMSGDRSSAGRLFQTTGPCTAKLCPHITEIDIFYEQYEGLKDVPLTFKNQTPKN